MEFVRSGSHKDSRYSLIQSYYSRIMLDDAGVIRPSLHAERVWRNTVLQVTCALCDLFSAAFLVRVQEDAPAVWRSSLLLLLRFVSLRNSVGSTLRTFFPYNAAQYRTNLYTLPIVVILRDKSGTHQVRITLVPYYITGTFYWRLL